MRGWINTVAGLKEASLTEVSDDAVDGRTVKEASSLSKARHYQWVRQDDTNWEATFMIGNHAYWFHAYRTKGQIPPSYKLETLWVINFGISKEDSTDLHGHKYAIMNMTGLRTPFGVMATVLAIFEDFIEHKRPDIVWFSDYSGSTGRRKLYQMASDLMTRKWGYEEDREIMDHIAKEAGEGFMWMLRKPQSP